MFGLGAKGERSFDIENLDSVDPIGQYDFQRKGPPLRAFTMGQQYSNNEPLLNEEEISEISRNDMKSKVKFEEEMQLDSGSKMGVSVLTKQQDNLTMKSQGVQSQRKGKPKQSDRSRKACQ